MLYLRPYKKEGAKTILSWCEDETTFRKWIADRYPSYPITEEDMNQIRVATAEDAKSIQRIYAPYVEKTAVTFEYDIPDIYDFQQKISPSIWMKNGIKKGLGVSFIRSWRTG